MNDADGNDNADANDDNVNVWSIWRRSMKFILALQCVLLI